MNLPPTLADLKLQIEYLSIDSLNENVLNPRKHSPRQINALARSMSSFGFVTPVIVDANNQLIAGHGRVMAARKIGLSQVPAVRLEHLTAEQQRALMIADNRLCDLSSWDDALLAKNFQLLTLGTLDLDLEATGFSMGEIDLVIEGIGEAVVEDPDDAVEPLQKFAITKPGDLFILGPHKIICGDAQDGAIWTRLMGNSKAAMSITDPPFNVRIGGHVSGLGKIRHREFLSASGEMGRDEFTDFLERAFRKMAQHANPGSLHFAFIDWRHVGEMQAAGEAAFSELKNICVWDKGRGAMGSLYRSQHELIFLWKAGRERHRNNVELGRFGRSRTNVWQYPPIGTFRHSDEGDLLALHPTSKPVRMIADAILDVSARGDIVLDPFMGAGATLIAAERVGRRAFGIELDALYVDTIIRRYERHSGEAAILDETGASFADVTATRTAAHQKEIGHA